MNKKCALIMIWILTFKLFLFGKVNLVEHEKKVLDEISFLTDLDNTVLILNIPILGELELNPILDSQTGTIVFANTKKVNLDLSPVPIIFTNIRVEENKRTLELKAKAQIFGRDAHVSLINIKRATDLKMSENGNQRKIILDFSEMTLLFNFDNLSIKLLPTIDLNFKTASLVLRKNKTPHFLVKSIMLGELVNFDFTFLNEGITLVKYFIKNDILLSKLILSKEFNYSNVILKSLSLTNQYKSEALFSKSSNFKVHGDAFADVNIIDEYLPLNLIDLPTTLDNINDAYEIKIKLPTFKLPLFGFISKGYLHLKDELRLYGQGLLELPTLGKNSFELQGVCQQDKMVLRGRFDHSINYDQFRIEMPEFTFNKDGNKIKIFGKSTVQDIKCLVELNFKDVVPSALAIPNIRIHSLQKNWYPFSSSTNSNLSTIELRSPELFVVLNNNGKKEIIVKGKTSLLNNSIINAQINFINNMIPILKIEPVGSSWKISDSFKDIKQFDSLVFEEAQFIITDNDFFDSSTHLYFNKGINFKGKLLLKNTMDLLGDLFIATSGDIWVSGAVSSDFKSFLWQAPLTSGLSTQSKKITIGPLTLQLNSNEPLLITSAALLQTLPGKSLNFIGNWKFVNDKMVYDAISSNSWDNVFFLKGFNIVNPRLHMSLDKNNFGGHVVPKDVLLEGDSYFGTNKMPIKATLISDSDSFIFTSHSDHFWLNELADIIISNKQTYSILPPLGLKNITFNFSPDQGNQLNGFLNIFGFRIDMMGTINNERLLLKGNLPIIDAFNMKILNLNGKENATLVFDVRNDQNLSKIIGVMKFGDLIEIHDPISLTKNGCYFESNTTLGKQKFRVKITGNSLGFINIPQFDLKCVFKQDSIDYFKKIIMAELTHYDVILQDEIDKVIADLKILENSVIDSLQDPEQHRINSWALDENKRKINHWVEAKLLILNSSEGYNYQSMSKQFDLVKIKFKESTKEIVGTLMPLTFSVFFGGKIYKINVIIDFENLETSISELVKEIKQLAL